MTHCFKLALSLALCALASASGAALAQDGDPLQRAQQEVEEGRQHQEAERYALAAERFLAAYEHMREAAFPSAPAALFDAGTALSHVVGREREAIELLQRFLQESTSIADSQAIRDRRSEALISIAELEARAPAQPEPSEELDAPDDEPPETSAPPPEPTTHISPIGPVFLGVGAAALLAAAIVGPIASDMDASFRAACDDLSRCPTALRPQYDEMRAFSTAADVLWVSGGLVAITGLILTLTLTEPDAPTAAASCTQDGCLGTVRGSF